MSCAGVALSCLGYAAPPVPAQPEGIRLAPDLRITESTGVAVETYRIADPEDDGAILIVGDDLVIDFQGATLMGARDGTPPDEFLGRGLLVRGRNVTIKNLKVHGYKIGIFAEGSPGIALDRCDVSRNYRQRLKSTAEYEDLSDWLYGHENDENEWLRYGAGIYLLNCSNAAVSTCRARNGQNGLCLVHCDGSYIVDNDMSFMNGWGLAMWRSSRCDVFNNKFDWCVRGYSHGVYSRGQDSAGILVYEQCNRNTFAFNSATHGGDGLFLYAGNETVQKTGKGGCNDNLIYRNDFSHAAANGIEATFSRGNRFITNILDECEHGVWAGYSSDTTIRDNTIRDSRYGVSIEHGHGNRIVSNTIENTATGIHLWWDDDKDLLATAFGKAYSGCPSTSNVVASNQFDRVDKAIWLDNDTKSRITENLFRDVNISLDVSGESKAIKASLTPEARKRVRCGQRAELEFVDALVEQTTRRVGLARKERTRLEARKGQQDAFLPATATRGRRYIVVDEWGPYDFSDVRLSPTHVSGGAQATFQLLGPPGSRFRITDVQGEVDVRPCQGMMPVKLVGSCTKSGLHDFSMDIIAEGKQLRATGMLVCCDWRVAFYAWSSDGDPRNEDAWRSMSAGQPVDVLDVDEITFHWKYASPTPRLPADYFATVATTELELPRGRWRVATVSDDGVRVYIDEGEVLANWTHHAPTHDETVVELEAGIHTFRVEHFEIDGYAQLLFRLEPAP